MADAGYRDRIKSLRRVRAGDLTPHPENWRRHPESQRRALEGVLGEVGWADAILVRELPDKSLQILDGHLRADLDAEAKVPVLVLDLDDAEARKLLATHDPLASLAEVDQEQLDGLLRQIDTQDDGLAELLEDLASAELAVEEEEVGGGSTTVDEKHQVIVECDSETQQKELYERLSGEGLECKLLTV